LFALRNQKPARKAIPPATAAKENVNGASLKKMRDDSPSAMENPMMLKEVTTR